MSPFASAQSKQSAIIVLNASQELYQIGQQVAVFEDKTAALSFQDILSETYQTQFKASEKESLNFGVTSSSIWIKFTLQNQSPEKLQKWLLTLDYPLFDYVDFYQKEGNEWKKYATGDMFAVGNRLVPNRNFVFPLLLKDNQAQEYYLRFQTQGSMQISLGISSELKFAEEEAFGEIGHGLALGFMIVMILYNLFVYFSLRDHNYLLYVLSMSVITLLQATYSGHTTYFLLPSAPILANLAVPLLMASANIFVALFSMSFLNTSQYAPTSHKILKVIIILNVLDLLAVFFLPARLTISFAGFFSLIMTLFLIYVGVTVYRNGNTSARFFLIAWILLLAGALLTALRNFGLLAPNFMTIHGLKMGSICEVLLLSFALSDRYNLFKKEKEIAQAEALRIQKEANENLEEKVQARTVELRGANQKINQQVNDLLELNQEIQSQKEEILTQRDALEEALADINEKNTQITASINYAKRIQRAMLPDVAIIQSYLPASFILYQPRDIVSGDFYYFEEEQGKIIIAAIDCTGHGVPGAFMSMMGNEILDRIIKEKHIIEVDEILNLMHTGVQSSLKQTENQNRDGMDMSICVIDLEKKILAFAGAKNPLYYVQEGELKVIKGNKYGVGGFSRKEELTYTKHIIDIAKPTQVFIFSDGYADEFGGQTGKKFMLSNFRKLLWEIAPESPQKQQAILEETMQNWLGNKYKQIDDILVIGFKV